MLDSLSHQQFNVVIFWHAGSHFLKFLTLNIHPLSYYFTVTVSAEMYQMMLLCWSKTVNKYTICLSCLWVLSIIQGRHKRSPYVESFDHAKNEKQQYFYVQQQTITYYVCVFVQSVFLLTVTQLWRALSRARICFNLERKPMRNAATPAAFTSFLAVFHIWWQTERKWKTISCRLNICLNLMTNQCTVKLLLILDVLKEEEFST